MTPDKARLAARRAYDCVKQAKGVLPVSETHILRLLAERIKGFHQELQSARLLRIRIEASQFFTMVHQEIDQQTWIRSIALRAGRSEALAIISWLTGLLRFYQRPSLPLRSRNSLPSCRTHRALCVRRLWRLRFRFNRCPPLTLSRRDSPAGSWTHGALASLAP